MFRLNRQRHFAEEIIAGKHATDILYTWTIICRGRFTGLQPLYLWNSDLLAVILFS